jgi:large subunit ribosomal protein L10
VPDGGVPSRQSIHSQPVAECPRAGKTPNAQGGDFNRTHGEQLGTAKAMSKYVKNLVANDIGRRLEGVEDALLVNVIGLDANSSVVLRKRLREKDINLLVVKSSLAKRATEGSSLAPAFKGVEGSLAVVWGGEDFISLTKEVTALHNDRDYKAFEARGGVMDGEALSADRVKEISKWPNRAEQLSILSGQILAPGANLSAALLGIGGQLASQIKQKSEEE